MEKYKNKYRIPSARLLHWDYGSNAAYFITICTKNRAAYFGQISNGKMQLNLAGNLAEHFWSEIPNHFSFIELGNFVIMPNHVHGILTINKPPVVETLQCNVFVPANSVETLHATSLRMSQCNTPQCNECNETLQCDVSTKNEQMVKISPKAGTISTIIRSYKSIVSKQARLIGVHFEWQTRFHEHIIRNAESFDRIQNYIAGNPENWLKDKFYCL